MIFVHGNGGHARVVRDALALCGEDDIRITDDAQNTRPLDGSPFIVAIGDSRVRAKYGGTVNAIHPTAYVSKDVELGKGIYIGAFAVVNPGSRIGDGVIINTGAIVEHDCLVEAFSHIAPGAVLCGNVKVGVASWIGANAVVKQGLTVAGGATVGCGAVVVKDVPAGETQAGNPARPLRGE